MLQFTPFVPFTQFCVVYVPPCTKPALSVVDVAPARATAASTPAAAAVHTSRLMTALRRCAFLQMLATVTPLFPLTARRATCHKDGHERD